MNTNWFNGFNLARVHAFLLSELSAVRDALEHLRESMNHQDDREWQPAVPVGGRCRGGGGGGGSGGSGGGGTSGNCGGGGDGAGSGSSGSSSEGKGGSGGDSDDGGGGGSSGSGSGSSRGGSSGDSSEQRREWERQCEVVMHANSALNMTEFARIVTARARHLLSLDDPGGPSAPPGPGSPAGATAPVHETITVRASESGARLTMEPVLGEDRGGSCGGSCSGGSGSGGSGGGCVGGARHEERWKVLALGQIRAVLRDLLVSPCADHVFLGPDDRRRGGGTEGAPPGERVNEVSTEGGGDRDRDGGGGRLRETLDSVEAYLASE